MEEKRERFTISTEEMEWEKKDLERKILINQKKLKRAPEGTLVYRKDGNGYRQAYVDGVRRRTYLTDNDEIARLFEKRLQNAWIKDYQ